MEQPLDEYSACNLGSVNLSEFVLNPFERPIFDFTEFKQVVRNGIRMLDTINIENANRQPLPQNKEKLLSACRVGLGATGIADMLVKMNLKYDTDEAINFIGEVMKVFKHESIKESIDLAESRGCAPILKKYMNTGYYDNWIDHHYWNDFKIEEPEYYEKMKKIGIRNMGLNTCAPNGSLAIIMQCSSGIEPIFMTSYDRRVKNTHSGNEETFKVYHPLVKKYNDIYGTDAHLDNECFVTSTSVDPMKRVKFQSMIQKYVSQSISATVNLPSDVSLETISDIYFEAWRSRCKGITVYRDGSRNGVLSASTDEMLKTYDVLEDVKFPSSGISNYRIMRAESKKWYVFYTIDPDTKLPNSIFVNTNQSESTEITDQVLTALIEMSRTKIRDKFIDDLQRKYKNQSNTTKMARMIGMLLRHRVAISEIVHTIESIKPPVFTFVYQLKNMLASYLEGQKAIEKCSVCGGTLVYTDGCKMCLDCGESKCG